MNAKDLQLTPEEIENVSYHYKPRSLEKEIKEAMVNSANAATLKAVKELRKYIVHISINRYNMNTLLDNLIKELESETH